MSIIDNSRLLLFVGGFLPTGGSSLVDLAVLEERFEAATGAPLAQFMLPIIHDPWGLKSGGTQTIYIPRQIFARRGDRTMIGAYGANSTVFPGYVALTSTASSFTVYLDMLDTANPYKVASYPDLPPANRPDTIAVIAEVYQYRLKTDHAHVKMEDPDKEFISFRWPIIVDGTKVRFGPFYHYNPNTLWTLYEPTAPESYWEFDLNTAQTSQWRYYFDREAAEKGQPPIKVANSGTTRPLVIEGKGVLLEIGTAINQQFMTNHPIIGGTAGVPNMLPLGNDPERATRYDSSTTSVALSDAALIAMGLTRGFGGTYPMPRLQLPAETPTKGWIFARVAIQVPTNNDFQAPSIYLKAGDGRNLVVYTMLMEKRLSARAAIYVRLVPYDVAETPTQFTVGYTGAGRITAGHQYYVGPVKGAITSGDFADAGSDDILFPLNMFCVNGRELPIWRDGVVPDRTSDGKVTIFAPGTNADTEPPYVQEVVNHAVLGERNNFTLSVAGVRGRPSFRASRTVTVIRKDLPLTGAVDVLPIGDSVFHRELALRLRNKLTAFGLTPTMRGTMVNEGSQPGEARGSWEYADFIGMDSQFPAVPIGGEAAYLAKSAVNADPDGRWGSNPFLRPSTGSDPAGSIFNGQVFDFPAYLSRFSIPVPNFVPLQLGTNDINLRTPAVALDQITRALAIMIPSILSASSTIRVGVGIPTLPRSELGDGKWTSHMVAAIRAIILECTQHARADCVPVWAHMSPDVGWPVTTYQTRAGRITGSIGDELHPVDVNRSLNAEAYAQWIACRS